MKNSKLYLIIFFFVKYGFVFSQTHSIHLNIIPSFGNTVVDLKDSVFYSLDSNLIKIETLKFYISQILFLKNGNKVLEENNSVHLVDAANKKSWNIIIENKEKIVFDEIQFKLGIDSITNISGAMGGDLDPTNGMYWTWQSGYINFKLEGTSSLCKNRNGEYQFHLGGYAFPYNCLQTLQFYIENIDNINIQLDIKKVLQQIDLRIRDHVMSPNVEAVFLSQIVANAFSIQEK